MNEHKNIQEARLAVMADVPYLQKRRSKELTYTFASEADLIHKVRDSLLQHGIGVSPIAISLIGTETQTAKSGRAGYIVRFLFTYRFSHSPSGTHEDVQTLGEAIDYGDKACNKAMTIALKYAIRQFLIIETGDDPDLVASHRGDPKEDWIAKAVAKLDGCKTETALDEQIERFRGRDPNTNEPLFSAEQLSELASYGERKRAEIREREAAK